MKWKNYRLWGLWLGIVMSIVLVLFVILMLTSQLHFFFNGQLTIKHDIPIITKTVYHGQNASFDVLTKIDTFSHCSYTCSHTVRDLTTGDIIYNSSNNGHHNFSIATPTTGFGKKLVSFESQCLNVPSLLCAANNQTQFQSSLLSIHYELLPEELFIVNNQDIIDEFLLQQATLEAHIRSLKAQQIPFNYTVQIPQIDNTIDERVVELWNQQQFYEASKLIVNQSESLEKIEVLREELMSRLLHYNETRRLLLSFDVGEYLDMLTFYDFYNAPDRNKLQSALNTIQSTNVARNALLSSPVNNTILANNLAIIMQMNTTYTNITQEGMLLTEQFKTNETQLSGQICPDINILWTYYTLQNNTIEQLEIFDFSNCRIALERLIIPTINESLYPQIIIEPVEKPTPLNFSLPQKQCCYDNQCVSCMQPIPSPLLFIHGHSFNKDASPLVSMQTFADIQHSLDFINGGAIDTAIFSNASLGIPHAPVSFRASYYFISTFDVGRYTLSVQSSERIENYALRLREIINAVRKATGAQKVTIVAHSMGGLVARSYIDLFGEDELESVITINTPHQGVEGNARQFCGVFGSGKECEDMAQDSVFLRRLDQQKFSIPFYAVRTIGCPMDTQTGDGIVTDQGGLLPHATNIVLTSNCSAGVNTHNEVLAHPQVANLIAQLYENYIDKQNITLT